MTLGFLATVLAVTISPDCPVVMTLLANMNASLTSQQFVPADCCKTSFGGPLCIFCNPNLVPPRVISLTFDSIQANGKINNTAFNQLTSLFSFSAINNPLMGSIPHFPPALTTFKVSNSSLTGYVNLTSTMKSIALKNTKISGSIYIPSSITSLDISYTAVDMITFQSTSAPANSCNLAFTGIKLNTLPSAMKIKCNTTGLTSDVTFNSTMTYGSTTFASLASHSAVSSSFANSATIAKSVNSGVKSASTSQFGSQFSTNALVDTQTQWIINNSLNNSSELRQSSEFVMVDSPIPTRRPIHTSPVHQIDTTMMELAMTTEIVSANTDISSISTSSSKGINANDASSITGIFGLPAKESEPILLVVIGIMAIIIVLLLAVQVSNRRKLTRKSSEETNDK
eukprot:NODE_70_length_24940_cov_0.663138.p8 type:complete len:398 gc:universal NODE_70_length_24940_cov_0.663138:21645-22838(+)